MKSPIPIMAPEGATIANFLYDSMQTEELNQDIVVVSLANGYAIEVDWLPENDPDGKFQIRVMWRFEVLDIIETKSAFEVAEFVGALAKHYDRAQVPISSTQSLMQRVEV